MEKLRITIEILAPEEVETVALEDSVRDALETLDQVQVTLVRVEVSQ